MEVIGVVEARLGQLGRIQRLHAGFELVPVPLNRIEVFGHLQDLVLDDVVEPVGNELLVVVADQHLITPLVNDLALGVHHLVVLQDVLTDLEVLRLDLVLGSLDGLGDHLVLDRHVLRDLQPPHDRGDPVVGETPHQVVFQRQVEAGLARVALAPGSSSKLVVDAPRLVALGGEHVQPAEL